MSTEWSRARSRRALVALVSGLLAAPLLAGVTAAPAQSAPRSAQSAHSAQAAAALPSVQARQADSLADSFGVSLHLNYLDTPYHDTARVKQAIKSLGARHARTNLDMSVPESYPAMRDIASAGIRFDLIMGRPGSWQTPARLVQTIATEFPTGVVESLEGANEYNLDPTAVNWAAELLTHQRDLWQAANANAATADLPVLAPALGMRTGFTQIGDMGQYADYGNAHLYPGGRQPSWGIDQMTQAEATVVPGKPVMYTETGYHNAMNTTSGHRPTPESVEGSYAPRLLLEHYLRGTSRVYDYELVDQAPDPDQANHEASFGLLRNDFSPKPAYSALKNLLALTADPGPATAPSKLSYSVNGAPSDLRQILVQKRNGEFVLLLWRDVSIYDPDTEQPLSVNPASVTVQVAKRSSFAVHRPSSGAGAVSTAQGTSVPVSVAGDVVALRIRTPFDRPDSPRKFRGKSKNRAALIRWAPPASDGGAPITGYVISGLPGKKKVTVTVSALTRKYLVKRLKYGKRYKFRIRAVNEAGQSPPAKVTVKIRQPRHRPGASA